VAVWFLSAKANAQLTATVKPSTPATMPEIALAFVVLMIALFVGIVAVRTPVGRSQRIRSGKGAATTLFDSGARENRQALYLQSDRFSTGIR
jgi:hypothetical protein